MHSHITNDASDSAASSPSPQFDFGYTWPWTRGHLVAAACGTLLAGAAWRHAAPAWLVGTLAALSLWAFAGFLIVTFLFRFAKPLRLPSAAFLRSGAGQVLDMGCGSGRTSLMVATNRPAATVVAVDNFSATYIKNHGPERLLSNFRAAGVEDRIRFQTGDMRALPFESAEFDAVVSSYAIDHLDSQGIDAALREANRVLRANGEFLLMVIRSDFWIGITYISWVFREAHRGALVDWRARLLDSGFEIVDEGREPGVAFYLSRKARGITPTASTPVPAEQSVPPANGWRASVKRWGLAGTIGLILLHLKMPFLFFIVLFPWVKRQWSNIRSRPR